MSPWPLVFEFFWSQLVVQFGEFKGCGLDGGGMSLEALSTSFLQLKM